MTIFRFDIHARDGAARTGVISTPRGDIRTPAFMPVGTAATVKAMLPDSVRKTGADIVLANTYHLMLRPGAERIARLGGLHRFMGWHRPILTDSGGFQVMSLSQLRKISEDGVRFRSHIDGAEEFLSPERAMEIQRLLGSDIQMVLDECPAYPADEATIENSLKLSMRWAQRSRAAFGEQPGHACFGIVQGGIYRASAPALHIRTDGNRLRRLRSGRARGGRRAGRNVRGARRYNAAYAARQAALPDGCRQAGRHRGRGAARHRYVRLRAADALRPQRPGLYARRAL